MSSARIPWLELSGFALLITLANLHLFGGSGPNALSYHPVPVAEGEWWRIVTHPLVHLSWRHLLFDALGFLGLYATLRAPSPARRLSYVAASAAGSLGLAALVSPELAIHGLSGLSGVAHGLLAVVGLELSASRDRVERGLGLSLFLAALLKGVIETLSGATLFGATTLGETGVAIAACHLGGVFGGAFAYIHSRRAVRPRAATLERTGSSPIACRPPRAAR